MKQEGVAVEETYTGNTMDAGNPVTTIVTWEIQEGREKQFETWRHEIEVAATKFPGHLGVNLIVPNNESREYTVIFALIRMSIYVFGKNQTFAGIC